jgi:biopolymer transport protein ExbD
MSRSKRMAEEDQELNLAPIMNMVVILIPLLLLSAVFVEVSVINITAPKLSVGPPSNEPPPDEKPLNLTVTIGAKGLFIAAEGGNLPPVGSCPQGGPTICFKSDKSNVDVTSKFSEARAAMANGASMDEGEKIVRQGLAAYDWRSLYNELVKIKKQFPKETIINVSADPEIPYSAVVRLMDISRYQLEKDEYGSDDEFWGATPKKKDDKSYTDLFNDPVLSIVQ